jgi:hypothetical protein
MKTPKSSLCAHGFGRRIKGKRNTKGSSIHPPPNPKEKGLEIAPRKSPRKGFENHQKGEPGTTHSSLKEPRQIIYTYQGGSYKVWLVARSSFRLIRSHHEALKLVLQKSKVK